MASVNVQRLADAGVIAVEQLSPADTEVVDSLSSEEVTVIIAIASKLYANRSAIRVHGLKEGDMRLMVPL